MNSAQMQKDQSFGDGISTGQLTYADDDEALESAFIPKGYSLQADVTEEQIEQEVTDDVEEEERVDWDALSNRKKNGWLIFWGDYEAQKQARENFLKPGAATQIQFRRFVLNRRSIAIVQIAQWAANLGRQYDQLWHYAHFLTNWAAAGTAIVYSLLTVAHHLNGDFDKKKTEYSSPPPIVQPFKSSDPRPRSIFRLWKWGTALYGFMLPLNLGVFLGFMVVELPKYFKGYMSNDPRIADYFEGLSVPAAIFGFAIQVILHIIPFTMSFYEFTTSSIKLTWYHLPWHILMMLSYTLFMFEYNYANDRTVYMSFDWNARAEGSCALILVMILVYYVSFLTCILYQDKFREPMAKKMIEQRQKEVARFLQDSTQSLKRDVSALSEGGLCIQYPDLKCEDAEQEQLVLVLLK